jgi:hypothetical protein
LPNLPESPESPELPELIAEFRIPERVVAENSAAENYGNYGNCGNSGDSLT